MASHPLYGKKKKKCDQCPNPLFIQWLTEWRDSAAEKGMKSQYTYGKVTIQHRTLNSIIQQIHWRFGIYLPCREISVYCFTGSIWEDSVNFFTGSIKKFLSTVPLVPFWKFLSTTSVGSNWPLRFSKDLDITPIWFLFKAVLRSCIFQLKLGKTISVEMALEMWKLVELV